MRSEMEIVQRIKAYEEQNDKYALEIDRTQEFSTKELYRAWIRKNLEIIKELRWVLEQTLIRF